MALTNTAQVFSRIYKIMVNKKYSYMSFMGESLKHVLAADLNDTEIHGTCFAQQMRIDVDIFPDGMRGVTFIRCNLDNVSIPVGNTVDATCCNRRILAQNDLEDWIVDAGEKPVEPLNRSVFEELGLSIDPKDIPAEPVDEPITTPVEIVALEI